MHDEHDICDWEGAATRVQGECGRMQGKLEDMKKALDTKIGKYESQRRQVESRHKEVRERLKSAVKDLVKTLNCVLDKKVEELESVYNPTIAALDSDLSQLSAHQASLSALVFPSDKSSRVGRFLPLAQAFLSSVSSPHFYPAQRKCPAVNSEAYRAGLDLMADVWAYGTGVSLENRWECRKCRNKNFPKSSICRKCGQTNRLLQRLLGPKAA